MPQSDLLHRLKALEISLHQSSVRNDPQQVAALLHDDFTEFGRSGAVYHKADILTALAQESPIKAYSQDYALTTLADGVALLTYRSARWADAGEQLERHSLRSSIWRRQGAAWQMVFHQGTPIEPFMPDGLVMQIEPLQAADLPAALSVAQAAILSTQALVAEELADHAQHIARNFSLGLAEPQAHLLLKAMSAGKLVGVMLVKQFWNLAELYVDPAWHGQGVGHGLLQQALAICALKSPHRHLRANAASTAVGFYTKYGFTHFAVESPPPYGCVPLIYRFA